MGDEGQALRLEAGGWFAVIQGWRGSHQGGTSILTSCLMIKLQ